MSLRKALLLIGIISLLAMIAACGAAPEPQIIVETVVVEKEVEKEVVVTKEVEVVKEVEKEVVKEVVEVVEVAGALPYPASVPKLGSAEVQKFNLDEMYTYKALDSYSQAPWLDKFVADGTLPPVEERLPAEPQVMLGGFMSTGLGEYGGIWRDFSACPTEGWNLGGGQSQGWFGINMIMGEPLTISGPLFMRGDSTEPMPNLAKSWEWSDDGMELTMNLIEGAKWSDGEPFTTEDIMFTFEDLIMDPNVNHPAGPSTWEIEGQPVTLEAVDDFTIKWTFPVPQPVQMLFNMDTRDFYIAPKHVWAPYHPTYNDDADYESFVNSPPSQDLPVVTLGPWVIVEYLTDELMVMRRNPYYWKVDEAGKQLPYMDEVTFEKGPSGVGRTLNTMAGSGDHSNLENPSVFIETMKRQAEPDAHFVVGWGPETLGYMLQVNQSATLGVTDDRDAAVRDLFRNVTFRRALSQAIDRDGLAQAVVRGPFLRAWPGGLYPGSTYYDRESVVFYPFSPDTSMKLLAEVGLEDTDGDGIVNWVDGPMAGENVILSLAANEDQASAVEMAEALVALFNDVGIQVNYRTITSANWEETYRNGEWDMQVSRADQAYAVPFTRAQQIAPITDLNPQWHYGDVSQTPSRELQPFEEELVAIVNEFALEPDSNKRLELMAEYNRIFTENVYDIGLVIGSYGLAMAKRFENLPAGSPAFFYQWTWANVIPEQIWVAPESQLDQLQPETLPVYE